MAGNTIMTAKNSFSEGLVMDFAPDNTQANCLTSALNATLLTFNGNEMSLQNDMGNGRVETAYLPDGYVPVGTCEFGDIIYIVSYNPIIDKAQIGCFPSPERNLSSEETLSPEVSISTSDFQKLDEEGNLTGELKATSVKKILFSNSLHPGDQYIIYAENLNSNKYISDYGNTDHIKGNFPKFVKISIVSIEDSGKMTYIDSNVKWYSSNNYYIQEGTDDNGTLKPDIDSYRTLVSSAYNTFASKVSGKLALLVELEKITGFDCTWEYYNAPIALRTWGKESNVLASALLSSVSQKVLFNRGTLYTTVETEKEGSFSTFYDSVKLYKIEEIIEKGSEQNVSFKVDSSGNYTVSQELLHTEGPIILGITKESSISLYIETDYITNISGTDYALFVPCYKSDGSLLGGNSANGFAYYIDILKNILGTDDEKAYINNCIIRYQFVKDQETSLLCIIFNKANGDVYDNPTDSTMSIYVKIISNNDIIKATRSGNSSYFIRIPNYDVLGNQYGESEIDDSNTVLGKAQNIYLNFSWTTDHSSVNPSAVMLTESKWESKVRKSGTLDLIEWNPKSKKDDWEITRTYKPEEIEEKEEKERYNYYKQLCRIPTELQNAKITRAYNADYGTLIPGEYYVNWSSYKDRQYFNKEGEPLETTIINDDIVNNYFQYPVTKLFNTFYTPISLTEVKEDENKNVNEVTYDLVCDELKYYYTLTPAMPYGRLDELSISGYIDFNKIGTNSLELSAWKYYVSDDILTLTFGLDAYTTSDNKITEVTLEFYNNEGLKAVHHLKNKNSYSGQFTNRFTLSNTDNKLNNIDHNGNIKVFQSLTAEEGVNYIDGNYYQKVGDDYKVITSKPNVGDTVYTPAQGILDKNGLYLVKIWVEKQYVDNIGNPVGNPTYEELPSRWLWTNGIFNEYYKNETDFVDLQPELNLDVDGTYASIDGAWDWQEFVYPTSDQSRLGSTVGCISQTSDKPNVKLTVKGGLVNDYNTFSLTNNLNDIEVEITTGNQELTAEQPEIKYHRSAFDVTSEVLYPTIQTDDLTGKINFENVGNEFAGHFSKTGTISDLNGDNYKNYYDTACLKIKDYTWEVQKCEVGTNFQDGLKYLINPKPNFNSTMVGLVKNFNFTELTFTDGYLYQSVSPTWLGGSATAIVPQIVVNDDNYESAGTENDTILTGWSTEISGSSVFKVKAPNTSISINEYEQEMLKSQDEVTSNGETTTNTIYTLPNNRTSKSWEQTPDGNYNVIEKDYKYSSTGTQGICKLTITTTIITYYTEVYIHSTSVACVNISDDIESTPDTSSLTVTQIGDFDPTNPYDNWYKASEDVVNWANDNLDSETWVLWSTNVTTTGTISTTDGQAKFIKRTGIAKAVGYSTQAAQENDKRYVFTLNKGVYKISNGISSWVKIFNTDGGVIHPSDFEQQHEFEILEDGTSIRFSVQSDASFTLSKRSEKMYDSEGITYISNSGDMQDTGESKVYKRNLEELQNSYVNLNFSAIRFSKYYKNYTTEEISNLPMLTSVVHKKDDLKTYNLALIDKKPYFRKSLMIGLRNPEGQYAYYDAGLLTLVDDDDKLTSSQVNWFKRTENYSKTSNYDSGNEASISYKEFINHFEDIRDTIKDNIFFPVVFGYHYDTDRRRYSKIYTNQGGMIAELYNVNRINDSGREVQLDCSLALVSDKSFFVEDNWITKGVQAKAKYVFDFLRHIFTYETSSSETQEITYINNYAYLGDNNLSYYRDIILTVTGPDDTSSCISIGDITLKEYLNAFGSTDNTSNVTFKFKGISKNIPFKVVIPYTRPEIFTEIKEQTYVKSSLDIPTSVDGTFEENTLYFYDNNSQNMIRLHLAKKMNYYEDATFDVVDDVITAKNGGKITSVDVSTIAGCFEDRNVVKFTRDPSIYTSDKYKLNFTDHNGESYGLTNFETGLIFFK